MGGGGLRLIRPVSADEIFTLGLKVRWPRRLITVAMLSEIIFEKLVIYNNNYYYYYCYYYYYFYYYYYYIEHLAYYCCYFSDFYYLYYYYYQYLLLFLACLLFDFDRIGLCNSLGEIVSLFELY